MLVLMCWSRSLSRHQSGFPRSCSWRWDDGEGAVRARLSFAAQRMAPVAAAHPSSPPEDGRFLPATAGHRLGGKAATRSKTSGGGGGLDIRVGARRLDHPAQTAKKNLFPVAEPLASCGKGARVFPLALWIDLVLAEMALPGDLSFNIAEWGPARAVSSETEAASRYAFQHVCRRFEPTRGGICLQRCCQSAQPPRSAPRKSGSGGYGRALPAL
jgi:hypothetical protein